MRQFLSDTTSEIEGLFDYNQPSGSGPFMVRIMPKGGKRWVNRVHNPV